MSKKITIEDAPADDDAIDIKHDPTDTEQDEWSETLEQAATEEAKEGAETESEASEESVSESDVDASEETEVSEEVAETNQTSDEETQPESEASENPEEPELSVDESLNEAVDEVVRDEADTLLAVEDAKITPTAVPPPKKSKFKRAIKWWWTHKRVRYGSLTSLILLLITLLFIPTTRYQMMNLAGVRVSSSIVIVNDSTSRPLKNIPVKLQDKEARTDDEGRVVFDGLKLGSSQLLIDKRGYATVNKTIVLGWGSNPLGEQGIVATGTTYRFVAKDWLSGTVLKDTEAVAGEDVGQADEDGEILLNVGEGSEETSVKIVLAGYRDEERSLDSLDSEVTQVSLVPARRHAFVSNRSGEYDIYAIDVDGKNEARILEATGKEKEIPHLLPHPTKDLVAVLSSREGEANADGFIYDALYTLDVRTKELYKITRSEKIQVVGWQQDRLIYVSVIEGVSAANSHRSRLISFDLQTKERTDLAAANYFNDVAMMGERIYYAVSSYAVPASTAKLYSVKADGSDRKTELNRQVWAMLRSAYDTMLFNAEDQKWYELRGTADVVQLETEPVVDAGRQYLSRPDGTSAVWSDVRDGKGVLLRYEVSSKQDTVIATASGLDSPLYWLNNQSVVYRVVTSQESVDMIISIDGGEARKITDVVGNRSRSLY